MHTVMLGYTRQQNDSKKYHHPYKTRHASSSRSSSCHSPPYIPLPTCRSRACTLLTLRLIQIRRAALCSPLDDTRAVSEACTKEDVSVREEALLERDDDKLRATKTRAKERANMLCMRKIKRGVDLVQYVHRRWLELQQCHDQRERDQRALSTAQLG